MGVYIKGMTMPKNCINCPLTVGAYDCRVTGDNVIDFLDTKPPHCPLVPVPPHGRLIDADVIERFLPPPMDELDESYLKMFQSLFKLIPTIIEAGEKE